MFGAHYPKMFSPVRVSVVEWWIATDSICKQVPVTLLKPNICYASLRSSLSLKDSSLHTQLFINSHSSLNCFYYLRKFHVNMALRAENPSTSSSSSSTSHLAGLPVFWMDATTNPTMDWDKWFDLFQVAMMPKYSISISELTRETTQQSPRVRTLLGDLDEDPANKKVISILYLSLGDAARKQFMDKYPHKPCGI